MLKKALLWVMVIVMTLFIFYFSSEPASVSAYRTQRLTTLAADGIGRLIKLEPVETSHIFYKLHYLIRKSAHFLEYMFLGSFITAALKACGISSYRLNIAAIMICLALAGLDERFQTFVAGRSGSFMDVAIDGSGAFLGILILHEALWLYKKLIIYNRKIFGLNIFNNNK